MYRINLLGFVLVIAVLAFAGCGGGSDDMIVPSLQDTNDTGIVRGEIDDGMVAFEFVSNVSSDPDNPVPGPFIIRGENLHYDTDLAALVVDLKVINGTDEPFAEPVSLTFVQLIPDSVTVMNPDNEEHGAGAMILCEFTNDDGMWTPGEESLPRSVQFGVAPGVSIGFVARIDVGMSPVGGAIGGIVWQDVNEDGVLDPDEVGIGEVGIALFAGSHSDSNVADPMWLTITAEDGSYRFDGLEAGLYTVVRLERDDLEATTPTKIQVLLVEEEGVVTDFLMANFGCRIVAIHDECIEVGDWIHAKGQYAPEPDRLVAHHVCRLDYEDDDDCDDDDDDEWEDEDKDGCPCTHRLVGPVTAVDLDTMAIAIMGSWVHSGDKHDLELEDVEVGERVRNCLRVIATDEGDLLVDCRLRHFNGHWDRVRGVVQEVVHADDGHVTGYMVLNTFIAYESGDCEN